MYRALKNRLAVLLAFCFVTVAAAEPKPVSEFTTTAPTKVKILEDSAREKNPEIDHFKHLCPGLGGYKVIHEGGDSRSWINLEFGGRTTDLQRETLAACQGQFPAKANDIVQWRGFRAGKAFLPYAIIYRMTSSADDAKQTPIETLIVVKLDKEKSRIVGHVPATEGNAKAEEMADRLGRP
jgi:hypothetical protein